ncbi:MAG: RNA pseudouridine synthase [Candidatus Wildermuthbacteria bacterium]|nr:RNA pseudouridine synthase [Candidatus Wildermuthbacteria bacterium]
MALTVLYEDNHVITVYKSAGVLTQGDKSKDPCLMDEVKTYIKKKYKKPGNVFLGLVHRLDRPVSGIVLFAKTSKGASRLSEQFRNHTIEKTYHALVIGKPDAKTLVNYLSKDKMQRKTDVLADRGQRAELEYNVVASYGPYTLVKIFLKTGRFHQIRAQFSFAGFPVLGDTKYGAPFALPDKSIALCATSIAFTLSTKDERKTISIPIPYNWIAYKT